MAMNGRSITRSRFAATVPRADKGTEGRTWAPRTPLAIRTSGVNVELPLRERIHRRLGLRLGKFAPRIERLSVRFEDLNGPRGGTDVACRIKAVMSALPSVVVMELAGNAAEAFDRAGQRIERAVRRALDRGRERGRVGRLEAPPVPVSGAARATTSRHATVRPSSTATRNRTRTRRARKATAAIEDSTGSRPSRKSTRRSANRSKQANKLTRRQRQRAFSPKAKRAKASRTH